MYLDRYIQRLSQIMDMSYTVVQCHEYVVHIHQHAKLQLKLHDVSHPYFIYEEKVCHWSNLTICVSLTTDAALSWRIQTQQETSSTLVKTDGFESL